MAQEKITIKFIPDGNVALVKAIKELNKATKKLNNELTKVTKSSKGVAQAQQLVTNRVSSNTAAVNANSTAFTRLQSIISVYRNKMLLASFATGLLVKPLINLVKLSADFEDLERGFNSLGKSINASSDHLNKLKEATNGTVDEMDLMKQANNAMMLGVVETEDEMAQLFDTAQRLGQALGVDTLSSINSMVTGMGRQSKLMLDNIGIMVDAATAYKRFSKEQGIQVKNLTDSQKKTAFNNEVLRKSKIIVDGLGEEILSTNQNIAQMQVSTIALSRDIGEVLTPLLVEVSEAFVKFADSIGTDEIKQFMGMLTSIGAIILGIKLKAIALGSTFVQMSLALKSAVGGFAAFKVAMGVAVKTIAVIFVKVTAFIATVYLLGKALTSLVSRFNKTDEHFGMLVTTTTKANDEANTFAKTLESLDDAYKKTTEGQLEYLDNLIKDAQATKMFNGLTEDQEKGLASLVERYDKLKNKKNESTDAGKAEADAIKASESAYNSTNEAQIKLLESQIKIIEGLDKTDPANKKAIAGLGALEKKLDELTVSADKFGEEGLLKIAKSMNFLGGDVDMVGIVTQFEETRALFEDEAEGLEAAFKEAFASAGAQMMEFFQNLSQERIKALQEQGRAEMEALKNSRRFEKMSDAQKKQAEKKITERTNAAIVKQFETQQDMSRISVIMDTAAGIIKSTNNPGGLAGIALASIVAAMGAMQLATINAQQPPKMAQGGLIGGRRHSQGGTLIEAEQGEFVMSRNAVDAIGVENLNRMNMGGAGGVNVSFSGNVMSDEFIENEAIPKIREAVRRGSDIGVS